MKLPDKKYEPKHNDELREYALGWNTAINYAKYLCSGLDDMYAKEFLSKRKKDTFKKVKRPLFRGIYDCILEIEKLNGEKEEPRIPVGGGFVMVKDKYICFDEDYTCPLFNRDKWKCQYCINTKTDKCPLLLP